MGSKRMLIVNTKIQEKVGRNQNIVWKKIGKSCLTTLLNICVQKLIQNDDMNFAINWRWNIKFKHSKKSGGWVGGL